MTKHELLDEDLDRELFPPFVLRWKWYFYHSGLCLGLMLIILLLILISPYLPGFMENIIDGTADIDQIDLQLIITDGLGVDKQATINSINSISSSGNIALSHSSIGSPINMTRPSKVGWVVNSME